MSMNLSFRVKLFGEWVEPVGLKQTPTRIANFNMTKWEYLEAYIAWEEENLLASEGSKDYVHLSDRTDLDDVIRRLRFYTEHYRADWSYG